MADRFEDLSDQELGRLGVSDDLAMLDDIVMLLRRNGFETSRVETSLLARLAAEVRALRAKNADLSERLALSELELRQSRT